MLKKSIIYTAIIIVVSLLVKLIVSPNQVTSIFEKGLWMGLGILLTGIITFFMIILLIFFIRKTFFKL